MPRRPAPDEDERMRLALEYVRRQERRRFEEELRLAWQDGHDEGHEEGHHEGYKQGFRKGWLEAGGDPALGEAFGVRLDDRAWARGVLHLPPDASLEEAQQAFRRLSKLFHPDLNPDLGETPFKTLMEAKRILGF